MSAVFDEAFTPCPSRTRSSGLGEHSGSETWRDSLIDGDDIFEPTGQIEFTAEVRAPTLTRAQPRRANRAGSSFQIHEDAMEKSAGPAEKRRRPNGAVRPSDRKSSLLAQPAQRFRPKVNVAPRPSSRLVTQETETRPKPSRPIPMASKERLSAPKSSGETSNYDERDAGLKKHVRRNTVYIPPDDTTVASVFMGLFSPLKKPDQETLPDITEDTQVNTLEARIASRQARKSSAVSARKAPLQPSAKIAQEAATRVEVAGKNGGKENIPPGMLLDMEKKSIKSRPLSKPNRVSPLSKPTKQAAAENAVEGLQSKDRKRVALVNKQNNAKSSPPRRSREKNVLIKAQDPARASLILKAPAPASSERPGNSTASRSSKAASLTSKLRELKLEYPMLTDDIAKPALYEDDWLSHQETVITQLVNALFECTDGDLSTCNQDALRLDLLGLYHTEYFTQLYRRLQASLSCGNLSIPKEILARGGRLRHDVGLRRKYFDVWIQSYDLGALVAALETVVGRKVSNDPNLVESHAGNFSGYDSKRQKQLTRKLEGFLEAFLLRNDDIDHSDIGRHTPAEMQAKSYRRTVLRSILLVVLLDQGRQCRGSSLPRRLFVPSSPCKSSVEVLQALTRILLPSCGDITKQLNHLGCHLAYKQHQLQEYDYQMDNIAVDMRDGVRLTRIVEVLFYSSDRDQDDSGDQTEITWNTGEALSLSSERDLPLSQHLKYPCVSRAAKTFNVQIALSALSTIKGSKAIVNDLRAEDIVDGYREKTIALLWALVGKWGLAGLVDWDDVQKEIARLRRKAVSQLGPDQISDETWLEGNALCETDNHAHMLQQWAGVLATLKGRRINNMTTSFADGKIYESIVDEYEPYIVGKTERGNMEATCASLRLKARLEGLGCSSQFAHLVSPGATSSHILDRDFTLGALAFLCSRLLSASKRARAATTLQRAWRAGRAARENLRRTIAKDIATHCAAVVQTRNEVLWAKEVITRWWRKNKAREEGENLTRSHPGGKFDRQSRKPAGRGS